ncbi:MAG: hypothetical protein WCP70_06275 [Methanothrix sp.]
MAEIIGFACKAVLTGRASASPRARACLGGACPGARLAVGPDCWRRCCQEGRVWIWRRGICAAVDGQAGSWLQSEHAGRRCFGAEF